MAPKKKNLNRCTKKLLGFIQSQYLPFINVIQMIIDNWRKEINFYYNDIANWFFFWLGLYLFLAFLNVNLK